MHPVQDRQTARLVLTFGGAALVGLLLVQRLADPEDGAFSPAVALLGAAALVLLFLLLRASLNRGVAAQPGDAALRHLGAMLAAQTHGIGCIGPDGIVRYASGFSQQGAPHRAWEGRPLLDCFQPDFRAVCGPYVRRALAGEKVSFTAEVNVTGLGPRIHDIIYTPLRAPGGQPDGFAYEIVDLTEKRAAEARTQIAHAHLQDAIESISEPFTLYDADQKLVAFNNAFRDLFRAGGESIRVGTSFSEVVALGLRNGLYRTGIAPAEWHRMRLASFDAADGQAREYELSNGAWRRVVESRTRHGGFVGIYADITAIKETERKARESEARLRAILDNAPFGIFLKDQKGRFVVVNRVMERMDPAVEGQPLGKTSHDILGSLAAEQAIERDRRVLAQRTVETAEIELPLGGRPRVLHITKFPVLDGEGTLLGIGCVASDLTQRRHLETQILQLQKMEAIGQLTGGVAHDFNNLLSVVLGNLSLLRRRLDAAEAPHLRLIDAAILASRRGASLTRQLLAFSRRQMLAPEAFRPGQAALDMQDLLRQSLGEHIDFSLQVDPAHWPAFLDRAQFENALLNLVINARDAMAERGALAIAVDNHAVRAGEARTADLAPGDYVRVRVRDTGHGMTPDIAARIFEPFFTTKGGDKGTGLGLSMVYGFTRRSGGHIGIETAPGAGTTVTLLFPRHDGAMAEPRAAEPIAEARPHDLPRKSYRILVVEDEELLRETAVALLSGMGHAVASAGNGPQALDLLQQAGPFDLLFTDLVMPGGVTGIELAAEARRRYPGLRVLATSGYASINVLRGDARELPLLLSKPYSEFTLASHIAQVFAEHPDQGGFGVYSAVGPHLPGESGG